MGLERMGLRDWAGIWCRVVVLGTQEAPSLVPVCTQKLSWALALQSIVEVGPNLVILSQIGAIRAREPLEPAQGCTLTANTRHSMQGRPILLFEDRAHGQSHVLGSFQRAQGKHA